MGRLIVIQVIAAVLGGWLASVKGRNIFFWMISCLFFPLLLLILVVLPSLRSSTRALRCPTCAQPIVPADGRCLRCNGHRPIELVKCSTCGTFTPAGQVCPQCGRR